MDNVTIAGAGVMGHGIAQLCAEGGRSVALYDINSELLAKARRSIENNLDLSVEESLIEAADKDRILKRIVFTDRLEEAVKDADLMIEAIPEVLDLKLAFYNRIAKWIKPDCIVASNTSTIPLSRLSQCEIGAQRMIIMHFFNPAQFVPLVEIVQHEDTLPMIVEQAMAFLRSLGKTPVLLKKDIPGFIANRLQAALVREALYLIEQGVADVKDIDSAVTEGPGLRWAFTGPAATMDFGGLDTWQRVMDHLFPVLCSAQQAPELIGRLIREGHYGTKTGQGIFTYQDGEAEKKIRERDSNFIQILKVKKRIK